MVADAGLSAIIMQLETLARSRENDMIEREQAAVVCEQAAENLYRLAGRIRKSG